MRVALMIEGQEDVTWPQRSGASRACEEHGIDTLFRSDHYISVDGHDERGSLETWATLAGLAAVTTRLQLSARLAGDVPAPERAGQARRPPSTTSRAAGSSSASAPAGWSASTRPTASRSRRWASAWSCSRSSSPSCAAPGPTGVHVRRRALPVIRGRRPPKPVQRPHPPVDHRRSCETPHGAPGRAVRRRVQHRLRDPGGVRRAPRRGRGRLAGRRPRPGDDDVLGDGAVAVRERMPPSPAPRRATRRLARAPARPR